MRRYFGKQNTQVDIPDLTKIQLSSYLDNFLQIGVKFENKKNIGLHAAINSVFPLEDQNNCLKVKLKKYNLEKPKFSPEECKKSGISYTSALRASLQLVLWNVDENTGKHNIISTKEEDNIFMCDIPMMTSFSTFIINGVEKIIISQMHRSPGIFFSREKTTNTGKFTYSGKVIPYRGSWLDLESDNKNLIFFRIDKKRKLPITILLKSIGMDKASIIDFFHVKLTVYRENNIWYRKFDPQDYFIVKKLKEDLVNKETKKVIAKSGQIISIKIAQKLQQQGCKEIIINSSFLKDKYLGQEIIDKEGNVIANTGEQISQNTLDYIIENKIDKVILLKINEEYSSCILDTLAYDKSTNEESALIEVCRVIRHGEIGSKEMGKMLLEGLFFNNNNYDLSEVGRIKLNKKLKLNLPINKLTLTKEDIKHIIAHFISVKDGREKLDDIDHLRNRRIRGVGELVENQFKIGLVRSQKLSFNNNIDVKNIKPSDVIGIKAINNSLKEFFNTFSLVQFADQTNPLSELTHKRRISALGPGGVNRERAGLEIRDVHHTHYGKICPIETPEGQNIGLINSLTMWAKINQHGFIESPYFKVEAGKITSEVHYLSADEEENYYIGQANAKIDDKNHLTEDNVYCRYQGNFIYAKRDKINFIDVDSSQILSLAASLIPFVEKDDAKRALMGSNMQRQAVPLLKSEAPFVGTGIEKSAFQEAGFCIFSQFDGTVEYASSERVIVSSNNDNKIFTRDLSKFVKSNFNTCINHKVVVERGQKVKKGQILVDNSTFSMGELSIGKNVLIAFIPFKGYTFEDSIVISEKIVKDQVFTSIHIEELETVVRDTRFGPEEITSDIPNVDEEKVFFLDETGIINLGAKVKPGDIIVGKVTPQYQKTFTPEEKMLRAIFGEKSSDLMNSSLYVPSGVSGVVIDVNFIHRRGLKKDDRILIHEKNKIANVKKNYQEKLNVIKNTFLDKINDLLCHKSLSSSLSNKFKQGHLIKKDDIEEIIELDCSNINVNDEAINTQVIDIINNFQNIKTELKQEVEDKIEKILKGTDLPQGVLKIVKVSIASKHKLKKGDKMSCRHGNKGVISKVVPEEDMPFLEDGTPIDMILNPLGIPSRMNIGQVFETQLGFASKTLGNKITQYIKDYKKKIKNIENIKDLLCKIYGEKDSLIKKMDEEELLNFAKKISKGVSFATPSFDGATINQIKELLKLGDQDPSGQVKLIDGTTGEYLDRKVTVGYKYMLKLHHLVENKVHARSVGPYSLVTQQPLGGKVHSGGQRLGEMEGWALQAYGASYILQEMLTIKSDDVAGRSDAYEKITKCSNDFKFGRPESFNVILRELQSVCLDIRLEKN